MLPPDKVVFVNHFSAGPKSTLTLTCTDLDGEPLWTHRITADTASLAPSTGLKVGPDGSIYFGGYYQHEVDFQPGEGRDLGLSSVENANNAFISSYTSAGDYRWTVTFTEARLGRFLIDAQGNLVLPGVYYDWQDFDPSEGIDIRQTYGFSSALFKWGSAPPVPGRDVATPAPAPAVELAPVVALDRQEPGDGPNTDGGLLLRELCRQAFLIAARDELQLATRDAVLREYDPRHPGNLRTFSMQTRAVLDQTIEATVRSTTAKGADTCALETPWQGDAYLPLVTAAAGWSLREFPEFLRAEKLRPQERPLAVPAEDHTDPADLTFIAQYQEVRRLHLQLLQTPRDPTFLAALSRAYAMLGALTQYHWSADDDVFAARALLYIERAIILFPENQDLVYTRAYARALAGFPVAAVADLDAAQGSEPAWAGAIRAYCLHQPQVLVKLAQSEPEIAPLAQLLRCLSMEFSYPSVEMIAACHEALELNPECYRLYAIANSEGGISSMHRDTLAPLDTLLETLDSRLHAFHDLPAAVASETTRLPEDPSSVGTSVYALRQADQELLTPRAPPPDPSWSMLASLIEDTTFCQLQARLSFMVTNWNVPTDSFSDIAETVIPEHPYANILKSYRSSLTQEDTMDLLLSPQVRDVTFDMIDFLNLTRRIHERHTAAGEAGEALAKRHADRTERDMVAALCFTYSKEKIQLARELVAFAPENPYGYLRLIETDWKSVKADAHALEAKFADAPGVLLALARQYGYENNEAEMVRLVKVMNAKAPTVDNYQLLANYYSARSKYEEAIVAWQEILKLPGVGLEQTRAAIAIARTYLKQGEYEKAEPYATLGAASQAEWAMSAAISCYFALDQQERAEAMMKAMVQRYPSTFESWWAYCLRTGRGDAKKAQEQAALQPNGKDGAAYCLFTGQKEKAARLLQMRVSETANHVVIAAMLAWQLDRPEWRDSILEYASTNMSTIGMSQFGHMATQIIQALPARDRLKEEDINLALLGLDQAWEARYLVCDLYTIVGLYEDQCGRTESAASWMRRAVNEDLTFTWRSRYAALAAQWLREHDLPLTPPAPETETH